MLLAIFILFLDFCSKIGSYDQPEQEAESLPGGWQGRRRQAVGHRFGPSCGSEHPCIVKYLITNI